MEGHGRRAKVSAACALILGCAFISLPVSAATTLTVGKASATSDALVPVNIGYELGTFEKHGLDLKIVDFTGGSKMDQAMAAGSLDISAGDGTEMAFIAKGLPMRAVCMIAGPPRFSESACRGIRRSRPCSSSRASTSAYRARARSPSGWRGSWHARRVGDPTE
jgi:hypothetical protein